MAADDLEKLVCATFDQSIKEGHGGYQSKVMTQLRFGHPAKAASTCEEWMKARPESRLARFTYAHVRCRLGQTELAAAQFSEWVNAHKDFANCIYLALFNLREGRTNQAVEAVRLGLVQPLTESPDADVNPFYLAVNGAMIAYCGGDYDLCESLCDKLLADSNKEKWWRRGALRIKAAAVFMKGQQTKAVALMKDAEDAGDPTRFSHEFQAKADQLLLDAMQSNNTKGVRDFAKWVDELDQWYSPFETDESGFHGSGLGVPTPYAGSWKTDYMNGNADQ